MGESNEIFRVVVEKHTMNGKDEFFTMSALTGELGELANVIKKMEFYKHIETYNKRVNSGIQAGTRKPFKEIFIDEAGDTLFYFFQLLNKMDVNIEDVMLYQARKLENQSEQYKKVFKK